MFRVLEFGNLLSAWQGINEYLFLECEDVTKRGGGLYGPEWVAYNNYVIAKRAWVDPEFDFGKVLGYSYKKWSALVNNYVDLRYLDLLRAELGHRVGKDSRSYNYQFQFSNKHGSGKDCLISLLFTKRIGIPHPIVVFQVRTSEVTKRLLFDFLLVQRIVEYVYGHNDVEVHLFAASFYITAESFVMYNNVKSLRKLLKRHKKKHEKEYKAENHKFQDRVLTIFDRYISHPDPMSIVYKVHRRSVLQIQKGTDGNPRSGVKSLFAKQLLIDRKIFEAPKEVISSSQHKHYKKHGVPISKPSNKSK
jgi:hypothetical protein